ncbi:MAG: hypothetical protein WCY23_00490 [Candidatus Omnitrophota bacterium]
MAKVISERFVRRSIINYLARKGWDRGLREKETAEHGVDIKVRHNRYSRYFFIETKGESTSKSAKSVRETAFVYSLGQIITRMKTGNARYYYGIGLPEPAAKIAIRRIPWQVAKKLLLYIFSVNHTGKVRQHSWQDLRKQAKE